MTPEAVEVLRDIHGQLKNLTWVIIIMSAGLTFAIGFNINLYRQDRKKDRKP